MKNRILPVLLGFLLMGSLFLFSSSASAALCKVGDNAMVLWGGQWWAAEVIEVNEAGTQCKVHYKGYGKKWDEWVGKKRIKIGSTKPPAPGATEGYYVGQKIKVLWGKKWWNARILNKKGSRYYIKYDGYGSQWNEWVKTSRMRLR